jgi:integrase/recombinase XerD
MAEHVVRQTVRRNSVRSTVLGPIVETYVEYLNHHGFAACTVSNYLPCVAHFAFWLGKKRIELRSIDEALVQRFIHTHLSRCHCPSPCPRTPANIRGALRHLVRMLAAESLVASRASAIPEAVREELEHFENYLTDICGLAPATCLYRLRYVREFLVGQFAAGPIELAKLSVDDIRRFVTARATSTKPRTVGIIGHCLRSYFRFRRLQGDTVDTLVAAIPRVAHWRLAGVPDSLTDTEVERFLNAFDRTAATGRRDYAIARCLADLGLRASEVAYIKLDDLNWRAGTLRLSKAKAKRSSILPLPVETGRAIAEYLRFARPKTDSRALFVRHRAPRDEPVGPSLVRNAVRCAYTRCGLSQRFTGTHVLRHTTASRLLKAGASLKDVADLLRHRSLNTTTIYAKVDLPRLGAVAMPWPGSLS